MLGVESDQLWTRQVPSLRHYCSNLQASAQFLLRKHLRKSGTAMGLKMTRELANSSWKNLFLPLSCPSARIQMRKEPPGATVAEGHGAQLVPQSGTTGHSSAMKYPKFKKRGKKNPETINSRNPTTAFHERLGVRGCWLWKRKKIKQNKASKISLSHKVHLWP